MDINIWFQSAKMILIMMSLLWIVSVILKNASIVDPFWGTGFVITGLYVFFEGKNNSDFGLLLMALLMVWGLRLSAHLLFRNLGKGEDFRYQQFRKNYGAKHYWWISFFQVFMLQGVILWIVIAPLVMLLGNPERTFNLWLVIPGFILWLTGFVFETVGDWQLMRFKANHANKGKLLTSGIWGLSRHPNYFGDALVWWGFWLMAAAAGYWWTIFSPVLMTFLLMKVSGVALLEKTLKVNKPGYEEYMEKTPAFFPFIRIGMSK